MNRKATKNNKFRKTKIYLLPLTSHFFKKQGQVMIEFAFCMIILFLMMYGIVMVFRWVGLDLGQRQRAHENLLTSDIDPAYGSSSTTWNGTDFVTTTTSVERGPLTQIDPYFYTPESMNSVWRGN